MSTSILLESAKPPVGREFQHLEDLIYIEGARGIKRVLECIAGIIKRQPLEVKWDGSPAIIFGRTDNGRFHFGDKYSRDIVDSPQAVYEQYIGRKPKRTFEREQFARDMAALYEIYEAATPKDFRGYLEAGLLYKNSPGLLENCFQCNPNTVIYKINPQSKLGQRIANSVSGCAATAYFRDLPATGGRRYPVGNYANSFTGNKVVVIPPLHTSDSPKLERSLLEKYWNFAKQKRNSIDEFVSPMVIKKILYEYVNSQINENDLDALHNLGDNFTTYARDSLSAKEQNILAEHLKTHLDGANDTFRMIRATMKIKDLIVDQLEEATLRKLGIEAELPDGQRGGEGFVYDINEGFNPIKLVKRGAFTRANKFKNESKYLKESISRNGKSDRAVITFGRCMGHRGHMYLANSVFTTAKEQGADPYVILSRTMGDDDPLTPTEKMSIYHKVFPNQKQCFVAADDSMPTLMSALKKLNELGYKHITAIFGNDRADSMKHVKEYNGKSYQFETLDVISRQQTNDPYKNLNGPRGTDMRKVLADPNLSEEQKFGYWRKCMSPQLSDDDVQYIMSIVQKRMGHQLDEADNPMYIGGNQNSPIPGTPEDLSDVRTPAQKRKDAIKAIKQARELRKFMGHKPQR
jgi:hypothetical protein